MVLISLFSGNLQFSIFLVFLLFLANKYYKRTTSIIIYLFLFLIAFPEAFVGETVLFRNIIYLFAISVLIINMLQKRRAFIKLKIWQIFFISIISLAALIIYTPILLETFTDANIFNGPEEKFISNQRDSNMLGFALPMLIGGPILILSIIRDFNDRVDLRVLYRYLKILTWIIVILSLIRFVTEIEFIPQNYLDTVRNDGYRLSGVNHPDSISYGKKLLLPLALVLSYFVSGFRVGRNALLLFFILISLFITYSRMLIASSLIIVIVIILYNFKFSIVFKGLIYLFSIVGILFLSGGIKKLETRSLSSESASGINMSGRDLIYETAIPIIVASPYVGLRPGGWNSLLIKGYSYTRQGYTGEMGFQSAHSFYLVVALEWGLPFLFLLIFILLHCLYLMHLTVRLATKYNSIKGFSDIKIWSISIIALITGLLILGITDFIPYPVVFFLIGLSWSLHLIVKRRIYLNNRIIEPDTVKM